MLFFEFHLGLNMNRHKIGQKLRSVLTKDILFVEYHINHLSTWKIADKHNCSKSFVLKYLNKYNIKKRNKSESLIGHYVSDNTRKNQSIAHSGQISSFKGKHHTEESKKLLSMSLKGLLAGDKHPNWQGGIGRLPYSFEFNSQLKREVRQRDNFTCQHCHKSEKEEIKDMDRILTIHHIDYNKQNCKRNNLITVCCSCNVKANFDRDYWFAYYTYIIENHLKEK